ncbi:hypothetical protein [Methylotetracoccus oryzae]|uniref:hypothetical protein n=1 Tax=Methylotetracoccus oryzae TaxID=1919059 RepID=UPI001119976C|nr:hypothetical protein [Methylotetracoccus oryzae]
MRRTNEDMMCAARFLLATGVLCAALPVAAVNDSKRSPMDPIYIEECGSCHVPYAAEFLPASSWKSLLGKLSEHFKFDAVPDKEHLKPISDYLLKHAGPVTWFGKPPYPEQISRARWFLGVHQNIDEVGWPRIRKMANCGVCHPDAQQGKYNRLIEPATQYPFRPFNER